MDLLVVRDCDWERMAGLIIGCPDQKGSTGHDYRVFVEGVLWIVRTGSPWRDLPEVIGEWNSVFRRFSRWSRQGVWQRIFEAMSDDPDFEYLIVAEERRPRPRPAREHVPTLHCGHGSGPGARRLPLRRMLNPQQGDPSRSDHLRLSLRKCIMCEDQIQEVVRQRYASAARAVSGSGGCCGAGGESDCCNPITSNLYADGETSGLPREAVLASLGCGNPMALAELREGSDGRAAVVFQSRRHLRLGSDDPARAPLGACVDPLARRPLHYRRTLVYGVDVVRKSGSGDRPLADQHLLRRPANGSAGLHHGAACRRGSRHAAGDVAARRQ